VKKSKMEEPAFPIIYLLKDDKIIYGCVEKKDFYKCELKFLDRFKNSIIIDSSGTYFEIDKAEKIGWGTWLLGYHPLMKGRSIKVKYFYKEIKKLEWAEFQEILINRLKMEVNPIWYPNKPNTIINRLNNSSNFQEVIELFSFEDD
jgi:hypothetical protein